MEKRPLGGVAFSSLPWFFVTPTVYVICYLESHRSPQTHDRT